MDEVTLDVSNLGISTDDINDQLLQVMSWDESAGTTGEWTHLGGVSSGSPASANVVSAVALSFSERIVTTGSERTITLPIELLAFTAELKESNVRLEWITASEYDNDFFEIQHSLDGVEFTTVGEVEGAGYSEEILNYDFVHSLPTPGLNYYRLKQVDYDGDFEFTPVVTINYQPENTVFDANIFPNPAKADQIQFRLKTSNLAQDIGL